MTLTEFLLARITEDERLVAEYPSLTPDFPPKWELGLYYEDRIAMTLTVSADRVLAECEAKRRIVGLHRANAEGDACTMCTETGPEAQDWPCTTLRLLVLPYADHPDYDESWRL